MDKSQRKSIGKAVRFLRTIYEIEAKTLAQNIGYNHSYQLNIESGNFNASDMIIANYCVYFKLPPSQLAKIGDCQTLIDAFKYLQSIGRF